MRDDPVVYMFASIGSLGLALLSSNNSFLLIVFLILTIVLSILGTKKSYDNKLTKIICIIVTVIASIYLIMALLSLLTWIQVRNSIKSQWSQ